MRDYFPGNRGRTLLATIVCATVCLAVATPARADEATGRWTGELEGRGNYYYERSTKVLLPSGRLALEAPNGVRTNVEYLVDVISTASVGARADNKDDVFTELRHSVGGGVGKLFAVGDNELDVSTHVIHSFETDYYSWIYGARAAYSFNQKNTSLSLGVSGVHDKIYRNLGPDMYDPTFRGRLDGVTNTLGFSQILSPTLSMGLSYQLVYLTGFLGNPYRRPGLGAARLPAYENPPHQRLRHNLEGQVSWHLPQTFTTLQAFLRVYTDSWDLQAITPELRLYQAIGERWTARLRFRYYLQGRAEFALANDETFYPAGYTGPLTNDPKLRAFHSEQVGLRLTYAFSGLSGTPLDFLSRAVLDVSLDHQWNSSMFMNPHVLIGTLGGRLPF